MPRQRNQAYRKHLVWEEKRGRNSITRGRIPGECAPQIQTQGSVGRHHSRGETSLVLLEAGRKAPGETGSGAKARAEEDSQRRFVCQRRAPGEMSFFVEQTGGKVPGCSEHFPLTKPNTSCTIITPASLRFDCCSPSLRNAVRLPSGTDVHLHWSTQ